MSDFAALQLVLLVFFGYLILVSSMAVLGSQIRFHLDRHEVLRQSKQMQLDYMQHLRNRGKSNPTAEVIEPIKSESVNAE